MQMKPHLNENGSSDMGIILGLVGLAVVVSIGLGIMGWIKSIKEDRISGPHKMDKNLTLAYQEPGSFQITCYPIMRYTGLDKELGCDR